MLPLEDHFSSRDALNTNKLDLLVGVYMHPSSSMCVIEITKSIVCPVCHARFVAHTTYGGQYLDFEL